MPGKRGCARFSPQRKEEEKCLECGPRTIPWLGFLMGRWKILRVLSILSKHPPASIRAFFGGVALVESSGHIFSREKRKARLLPREKVACYSLAIWPNSRQEHDPQEQNRPCAFFPLPLFPSDRNHMRLFSRQLVMMASTIPCVSTMIIAAKLMTMFGELVKNYFKSYFLAQENSPSIK